MATKEFPLVPEEVKPVETKYRRIQTKLPVPESVDRLKRLRDLEPRSMGGQPPIIWKGGRGANVFDPYGNMFLDFSSGVLVTVSGHGHPAICKAIAEMAQAGLYHAYCFPTDIRARLVEKITSMLPAPLAKVFLLTTGSEATECCIKLARTHGMAVGGAKKSVLVTFENAFHGRTMGAQWAGGSAGAKAWLGDPDPRFVNVPYPDGFRQKDVSFDVFVKSLADQGIEPDDVCGVMSETYQGCNATLLPVEYVRSLRRWCDEHQALLIFDEVQAGFGRCGKAFGFMHFGVVPDLAACGKGISGGMPLSAVVGKPELMDQYGPGEMTSTHSANPVCSAAALANLEVIESEGLIDRAGRLGEVLLDGAQLIKDAGGGKIQHIASAGMVAALQFTAAGTTEPNPDAAWQFTWEAVKRGIMLFAPVGVGGCAVKLNPPLTIEEDALREGLGVLQEVAADLA
ncbi:MAG TPA: aspartate aminotransferase family protein [Phycisphaerae bacterium]|nr:aspartate aminotransferase family protein [Phycisphaerae bacterium]